MATVRELLGKKAFGRGGASGMEGNNLGESGLEEHIAHWADVLDRWVKGIDMRLGRDEGQGEPGLDEFDAAPGSEQSP
ncbi:MAG: hypothetical protein QOI23_705 [Chloroflexota bacterium]|nr:hypothetical protein [Chloroflexota bacterium]